MGKAGKCPQFFQNRGHLTAQLGISDPSQRTYQRHGTDQKRQIVEESLRPGASVARVAWSHGVNANQVFNWRKQFWAEILGAVANATANLVPVSVAESKPTTTQSKPAMETDTPAGRLRIESPRGSLVIEGQPDFLALRLALESLFE